MPVNNEEVSGKIIGPNNRFLTHNEIFCPHRNPYQSEEDAYINIQNGTAVAECVSTVGVIVKIAIERIREEWEMETRVSSEVDTGNFSRG